MNFARSFPLRQMRSVIICVLFAGGTLSFAQSAQVLVHDGGSGDQGYAAATDATGALILAGYSSSSQASPFVLLKYNAAGSLQWLSRVTGLGDYAATAASDVATDPSGNIYASGYAMKPLPFLQNDFGWVVASFAPNGAQRWIQLINGPGNSSDSAQRIAVHPQHGVYVIGVTTGAFGRADWLTVKYSLTGVEQWRHIEPGAGNTDDRPVALNVDASGNVVVLGYVQPVDVSGPKDVRVVKRNAQGALLWRADYSATATSDESPSDLAVDTSGNIYVTLDRGVSTNPELESVPVTLKLDANGNRQFLLEGAGRGGSAVALDSAGNVIVSGVFVGEGGSNLTPRTSKFTSSGELLWSLPFSSSHLAIDDLDDSIYLSRGYTGFNAVKISSGGQVRWEQEIVQGDRVNDALVDAATGDFILMGGSDLGGGNIIAARFSAIGVPPPPPPVSLPAAPSSLTTSPKKGAIGLSWNDNSNNETGFSIERSTNGGAFIQIAQVGANVRSFENTGLAKKQTYAFRLRAFNTSGNSAYSNTATGTPR